MALKRRMGMIGTENLPGNLFHHQLAPLHHSLTQTWRKHTNKWYRYDASKIYQVIQFPFNFKRKCINILFAWRNNHICINTFLKKVWTHALTEFYRNWRNMEHITEFGDNRPKYFFIVWHVYSEYFKMVSIRIPFPPQIHIFLVWKWLEKLT